MTILDGAIDLHVHSYPDLVPRAVDDLSLAEEARDAGLAGFVLKSHYAPTAERAWLVNRVTPEVRAIGSIVLNHFVGGLNPLAVEALARAGGRIVFMPTSDAANEANVLDEWDPGRALPPYLQIKSELRERGMLRTPISLVGPDGEVVDACREVLEVIKQHDLVLATGHVSGDEVRKVVHTASSMGIQRILVTHPESPHIDLDLESQIEMIGMGVVFERCFAYLADPATAAAAYEAVRRTGVQRNVLSSDLGMVGRESPVEGLTRFATLTMEAGFSEADVRQMLVTTPTALVGP
jgi:hypothetical protein